MSERDLALLPVFLPLVGAAFAMFAKALHGGRGARTFEWIGAAVGLAAPWGALVVLLPLVRAGGAEFYVGTWNPAIAIAYRFDGLAWLVDVLGFAGAGASYLYSRGAGPRGPLFTAIFLIQTSALAATASSADLFNLFVCLEILGLASYVLVGISKKSGALLAAFSYLAISSAAMAFFLFGLFGLYRLTGALSYRGIAVALAALPDAGGASAALSTACLAAAVAIRVAVMPVYGWLPDAHAMAPHAVSAVLSGVLIKTPLFALARLLAFLPAGIHAMELIGMAGVVTALAGVLVALSQKDAKRLLAYHSVSQIGYVAAAWGVVSVAGLSAAFLHAFFHALFKGLLFLSIGTATDAAGDRDVYKLRGAVSFLRFAGDRRGLTAACYAVGAFSIAAVPPFNGFASKIAVSALFKNDWRYWALFLAGIGTIASFVKLSRIFLPSPIASPLKDGTGYRVTPSMKGAMLILASLCLATGLTAKSLLHLVGELIAASSLPAFPAGTDVADLIGEAYSVSSLTKTAASLGLGFLVFLGTGTSLGKRLSSAVRNRPRSFQGLVLAFCLGLLVVSARLLFLMPRS